MSLRLVSAVALMVLIAAPSLAADFIHRKAGLWSVTMQMEGVKVKMPATKMCLDADTDTKLMQHSWAWRQKECDQPSIQGMGSARTIDVVCHRDGGVQKTHVAMSFNGDNGYHMDIRTANTPPLYGRPNAHMTQDATWSGPCPADMKPGDMMVGSMKINVLNSQGGMPAGGHMTKEQIQALIKAHQH